MDLVRNMTHAVRKPCHVGLEGPIRSPSGRPAVVQDNIVVAKVAQPVVDDLFRSSKKEILANITGECIPVILCILVLDSSSLSIHTTNPSHSRSYRKPIVTLSLNSRR